MAEESIRDDEPLVEDPSEESYRCTSKFKVFRKHARELYQSLATLETCWPASTIQFLPYTEVVAEGQCAAQTLLTGSSNNDQQQNYVRLLQLVEPLDHTEPLQDEHWDDVIREIGTFGMAPSSCKFEVSLVMAHDGDVRRARYIPHNPNIIVTASGNDNVYVFDKGTIGKTLPPNNPPRPRLPLLLVPGENANLEQQKNYRQKKKLHAERLTQQDAWDARRHPPQHRLTLSSSITNGWALDISVARPYGICLGGSDGIAVWSLADLTKGCSTTITPTLECHQYRQINDAKWHPAHPELIALGFEEQQPGAAAAVLDLRAPDQSLTFHPDCGPLVNSVCWSPSNPDVLAIGGSDGRALLYDLRNVTGPIAQVQCHEKHAEVVVLFCPHDDRIIATGGSDGNASVCRVSPCGQVLFMHTGHKTPVMDLCWSPHEAFAGQVASVDDNAVSVWKPRNNFWG